MIYRCFLACCLFVIFTVASLTPAYAGKGLDEELVYEATLGDAAQVEKLLRKGANPNATSPEGWTALAIAANRIDDEAMPIVKLLVEEGANVNGGLRGYQPVVNAARNSQVEIATYLLQYGADPRSTDHNGRDLMWISHHVRAPELQKIIEEVYEVEKEKEKSFHTEEYLKSLVEEYSYALCEAKYWAFYVASSQDSRMSKVKLKTHISQRINDANHTARLITMYFPDIGTAGFVKVGKESQRRVQKQLEDLVSNRNRKKLGVGTRKDMDKRCSRISHLWNVTLKSVDVY